MSAERKQKANATRRVVFADEQLAKLSEAELLMLLKQEVDQGLSLAGQAKMLADQALQHFINAGAVLTAVKTKVGHGQFESWVKDNFDRGIRTAERHMKLYANRDQIAKLVQNVLPSNVVTERYALQLLDEHEVKEAREQQRQEREDESEEGGGQVNTEEATMFYKRGLRSTLDRLDSYHDDAPPWAFALVALDRLKALVAEVEQQLAADPKDIVNERDFYVDETPEHRKVHMRLLEQERQRQQQAGRNFIHARLRLVDKEKVEKNKKKEGGK